MQLTIVKIIMPIKSLHYFVMCDHDLLVLKRIFLVSPKLDKNFLDADSTWCFIKIARTEFFISINFLIPLHLIVIIIILLITINHCNY